MIIFGATIQAWAAGIALILAAVIGNVTDRESNNRGK
jgi:hypothetical protein